MKTLSVSLSTFRGAAYFFVHGNFGALIFLAPGEISISAFEFTDLGKYARTRSYIIKIPKKMISLLYKTCIDKCKYHIISILIV